MGQHKVNFDMPERLLGQSDIRFTVYRNDRLLGRLLISQGCVEWVPRYRQSKFQLTWRKLAELFEEYGRQRPKV